MSNIIQNLLVLAGSSRSQSVAAVADEKYAKHVHQQMAKDRLRRAIVLFGAALMVLTYTWTSLAKSMPEESAMSRQSSQQNHRSIGGEGRRGRRRQGETMEQGEEKPSRMGMLDRVFGRDPKLLAFQVQLEEMDKHIIHNIDPGIRWVKSDFLPELTSSSDRPLLKWDVRKMRGIVRHKEFMVVKRQGLPTPMAWERDAAGVPLDKGPLVDFTKHLYDYPDKQYELPTLGDYPKLTPMKEIMKLWPQDDVDHPPSPFTEVLIHFDFTNPKDLEAATLFRDAKLPFKLINVPEVAAAGKKWTDSYVTQHFDKDTPKHTGRRAQGTCQESPDNFFAFFTQGAWSVEDMGVPPTRNNDWTFAKWAEHARYADAVGLSPHQPHFYWQAGVDKEERREDKSKWTFISRDLPSFSSPTETFFVFEPELQKGIQCRFGERGVTAATHFDSGRNMIAMMTGAKRYILSPPRECPKLGIVTGKGTPIYRHSMLNFGHLNEMSNTDMPSAEREWLERSGEAMAIDTVLKAGEVLYIPSHWFHYITSLQKSAQCNVRSGIDVEGDDVFGGQAEVTHKCNAY